MVVDRNLYRYRTVGPTFIVNMPRHHGLRASAGSRISEQTERPAGRGAAPRRLLLNYHRCTHRCSESLATIRKLRPVTPFAGVPVDRTRAPFMRSHSTYYCVAYILS
jgi:hypothetical protein